MDSYWSEWHISTCTIFSDTLYFISAAVTKKKKTFALGKALNSAKSVQMLTFSGLMYFQVKKKAQHKE